MARRLRVSSAGITHPDERHIPADQRVGSQLVVRVISEDLKGTPVHELPISEDEALALISGLSQAVLDLRRARELDERRRRS